MTSVIVPVYNAGKYLKRCVESVCAQTCQEYEVLLVDDGSTDESGKISDGFAASNSRVHVIHQENAGLISARQTGFRASCGEWILFVDSDDWIAPDMLKTLMDEANRTGADVVTSGAIFTDGKTEITKYDAAQQGEYEGAELEMFKTKLLGNLDDGLFRVLPFLWNKLWRREVLEKSLNAVDPTITVGEDVAIGLPALLKARKIVVTNQAFYYYRQDNDSMTRGRKACDYELENAKKLCKHLYRQFKDAGYLDLANRAPKELFLNQLYTRAYEKVNQALNTDGCSPFLEVVDKPIVVYGAGAFGSAVYDYLNSRHLVKFWVDTNAAKLRNQGKPVVTLEEVKIEPDDIIVVPVFNQHASNQIYEVLRNKGVANEQILLFHLTEDERRELLCLAEN